MLFLKLNIVLLFLVCMKSDIHCFVSAVVVENANNNSSKCNERERHSLLMFKESLVDNYGRLSSWEIEKDCCKWSGVRCSSINGHVIMLNLSAPYSSKLERYSSLRGNITSPSLLVLRHLSYLDLSFNDFGSTPIPNFIGSFPHLKYLDLSGANFGGIIPFQLGNLSQLHHLDLSFSVNIAFQHMEWLSRLSSLTHLSLRGNNLEGSVPNSLSFANLCNLMSLDLSMNNLNGTLSSLLKDLACAEASLESLILTSNTLTGSLNGVDITRYPSLRKLSLDNNSLTGFLPNEIGKLYELQHLDVSFNYLRGVISENHFLNLSKLRYLDLSDNTFALELSSQWISPFQLDTLVLGSCVLGPRFPKWLQTQTKISHLDLSNSRISDNIPFWFWNQSTLSLQLLDLSHNKLRGTLPDLSSKFVGYPVIDLSSNYFVGLVPQLPSSLAILNLSQNKFSGRLSSLCSINRTLIFLDLSHNLFSGGFPGCFEYFQEINVLNLAHNKLSGKIPSYLSSLSRLETLVLRNNSFFGELPSTLKNSKSLSSMDMSGNKLSGNIPAWIGENLPKLEVIRLGSNKFNGSIPLQLCHLTKLYILDLSQNSLSGSIPRCFNNFTVMSQEHSQRLAVGKVASRVHKGASAYIDEYYANILWYRGWLQYERMIEWTVIDLSSNRLTGQLHEEITKLEGLRGLNLSSNQLCGVLPQKIGQLRNLEALDLSRNKFSGEIPPTMTNINFLEVLNLSYNNFSGRIPKGKQFNTFEGSSYTGNNGLCGFPVSTECQSHAIIGGGNTERQSHAIIGGGNVWFCMVIALGFTTSGFWEFLAN